MLRALFALIFLFTLIVGGYFFKKSITYEYKEPNISAIMQSKLKNGYLDKKIVETIKSKNFDDLEVYSKLANRFGVELNSTTKKLIEKENTTSKKIVRNIESFTKGFLSGKANNGVGVAGSITSDFTLYGDLRDIYKEGNRYLDNKPYDKYILALSMIGVGLSGATIISLGGASGVKVATSTLKLAKREKMLTKGFSKVLGDKLSKTVNFKALKEMKFNSIAAIKKDSKIVKNSINIKPIKPIFKDINQIYKNTSLADSIHLLKYVDNTKDLKAVAKLGKRYKGATRGIFKVLGKNAIRLVKGSIKWSAKLIYAAILITLSILGFFMALFSFKKVFF